MVLESQSRDGYFGDPGASTKSNAAGEPRIVLTNDYGTSNASGPSQMPVELQGVAGRYVGKVTIVTGGGRGIGEGCVRVFFAAGSNVVISDRNEEGGTKLADELNVMGASNQVFFVKADVSKTDELRALVEATIARFGRIDCVVNNAGWHPPPCPIDDFSIDDMQNLMQLNFMSMFALSKFALPHLRQVQGNIINMSSLVGAFGQAKATTYAATKGATTSFTKALAIDEAEHNVRVNCVSPGNIWTPLWKEAVAGEPNPAAAKQAGERVQHLGRMGTSLEAGRLCLCIAADLTFTTGVDHILSGGAEIGYGIK